jgi:hypothetical protein
LKAGESLIFDDSLIHWSAQNSSDRPRYAIQILCIPSDCTPVFFYFDANAPEKGFELFEVDSNYFIEHTIMDFVQRPTDAKRLGFIRNRNRLLSEHEFAEKLKNGDEIRRRIYFPNAAGRIRNRLASVFRSFIGDAENV